MIVFLNVTTRALPIPRNRSTGLHKCGEVSLKDAILELSLTYQPQRD